MSPLLLVIFILLCSVALWYGYVMYSYPTPNRYIGRYEYRSKYYSGRFFMKRHAIDWAHRCPTDDSSVVDTRTGEVIWNR